MIELAVSWSSRDLSLLYLNIRSSTYNGLESVPTGDTDTFHGCLVTLEMLSKRMHVAAESVRIFLRRDVDLGGAAAIFFGPVPESPDILNLKLMIRLLADMFQINSGGFLPLLRCFTKSRFCPEASKKMYKGGGNSNRRAHKLAIFPNPTT